MAADQIKLVAERELTAQGLSLDNTNPDMLLTHDLLAERVLNRQSNPVYSPGFSRIFYNPYARRYYRVIYPSRFMVYNEQTSVTNEGTVVLSFSDARTDKTLMQGWSQQNINSRVMTSREADAAVSGLYCLSLIHI